MTSAPSLTPGRSRLPRLRAVHMEQTRCGGVRWPETALLPPRVLNLDPLYRYGYPCSSTAPAPEHGSTPKKRLPASIGVPQKPLQYSRRTGVAISPSSAGRERVCHSTQNRRGTQAATKLRNLRLEVTLSPSTDGHWRGAPGSQLSFEPGS
jgi:hypothetical protein